MERERKIYDTLDSAVTAKKNCYNGNILNTKWGSKWDDLIDYLQRNHLPHGSGFDCGCKVVEEECVSGLKLVIGFSYHHMDDNGYYDGWSDHKAIVIPYFDGIGVTIKGALPRKYRASKEYFSDTLHYALTNTITQSKIDEILNVERGTHD